MPTIFAAFRNCVLQYIYIFQNPNKVTICVFKYSSRKQVKIHINKRKTFTFVSFVFRNHSLKNDSNYLSHCSCGSVICDIIFCEVKSKAKDNCLPNNFQLIQCIFFFFQLKLIVNHNIFSFNNLSRRYLEMTFLFFFILKS